MSILKIARMGHPLLASGARPVDDPTSDMIKRLAGDMAATLADAGGVGLAAPQVHVALRLVILHIPAGTETSENTERYRESGLLAEDDEVPLTVLINPEYTPMVDAASEFAWEGCLSLPGLTGFVPRYQRILCKGVGTDGAKIEYQAEGFHARVIQHELDHLDGVLFPMRMPNLERFGFTEEIRGIHTYMYD